MPYPVIPEYITVHLGAPDAPAENVTVTFPRYIKGVAASEIYPTWNESAIRANVLAQISVALNRVYTEFYRSRGYDFDITNNTQYDQAFSPNKETFENINAIVDDIFNNYIVRRGNVEPLYAQFCDGIRTQCRGLSQWGSQELAQQGRTPYEILQYYYGQDIDLVYNAPVGDSTPSYPGRPLTVGSVGEDVRTIQRELNRIRKNYPALPAVGRNPIDDNDEPAVPQSADPGAVVIVRKPPGPLRQRPFRRPVPPAVAGIRQHDAGVVAIAVMRALAENADQLAGTGEHNIRPRFVHGRIVTDGKFLNHGRSLLGLP